MSRLAVVVALLFVVPRAAVAYERQRSVEVAIFPVATYDSDAARQRTGAGAVARVGYETADWLQLRLAVGVQPMGPLDPGWQPFAAAGARFAGGAGDWLGFLGFDLGAGWSRYSKDVGLAPYELSGPRAPERRHLDFLFTYQSGVERFLARDQAVGVALWMSMVSPNVTLLYGLQLSYRRTWGF